MLLKLLVLYVILLFTRALMLALAYPLLQRTG